MQSQRGSQQIAIAQHKADTACSDPALTSKSSIVDAPLIILRPVTAEAAGADWRMEVRPELL
jgi:hypothetical protein